MLSYTKEGRAVAKVKFVLLNPTDNVLVSCQTTQIGESVMVDGKYCEMMTPINVGHKIARKPIIKGDKIIKYGVPIGSAITNIAIGEHVHLHNMKSDYISSHTRQSQAGE